MNRTSVVLKLLLSNLFIGVSSAILVAEQNKDNNRELSSRIAGYEPETSVSEEVSYYFCFTHVKTNENLKKKTLNSLSFVFLSSPLSRML